MDRAPGFVKRTVGYMAFRSQRCQLEPFWLLFMCSLTVLTSASRKAYTRRYNSFRYKLIQSRCTSNISRHLFFLFTRYNYTSGNRNIFAVSLLKLVSKRLVSLTVNSWVSRDVTGFAQVSVRHVGVPRVSNLC